jgi:hypothetical protein
MTASVVICTRHPKPAEAWAAAVASDPSRFRDAFSGPYAPWFVDLELTASCRTSGF